MQSAKVSVSYNKNAAIYTSLRAPLGAHVTCHLSIFLVWQLQQAGLRMTLVRRGGEVLLMRYIAAFLLYNTNTFADDMFKPTTICLPAGCLGINHGHWRAGELLTPDLKDRLLTPDTSAYLQRSTGVNAFKGFGGWSYCHSWSVYIFAHFWLLVPRYVFCQFAGTIAVHKQPSKDGNIGLAIT